MGINQRVSLRKFIDDIRRWVDEDRSDEWIASALGTSPSSVQSFRSRNAIYRRHATTSTLHDPKEFSSYEGALEPEGPGIWFDPEIGGDPRWQKRWKSTERIELRLTPTRIVFLRRGGARGQAATRYGAFRTRGANVGDRPKAVHDTFDAFMEMERARIQEHASGKMARALGYALPGESQEDLDRKAQEDQRLAQEGMVKLKVGQDIHYKHIDELTREDRKARMAAECEEVDWRMKRLGLRRERSR